jgi:hypothetical protein
LDILGGLDIKGWGSSRLSKAGLRLLLVMSSNFFLIYLQAPLFTVSLKERMKEKGIIVQPKEGPYHEAMSASKGKVLWKCFCRLKERGGTSARKQGGDPSALLTGDRINSVIPLGYEPSKNQDG